MGAAGESCDSSFVFVSKKKCVSLFALIWRWETSMGFGAGQQRSVLSMCDICSGRMTHGVSSGSCPCLRPQFTVVSLPTIPNTNPRLRVTTCIVRGVGHFRLDSLLPGAATALPAHHIAG